MIDRRVGENELEAIETVRAYVGAQRIYDDIDWDEDGVLEYAQNLISTPGSYDGLYWQPGDGVPDSPAGPFVSQTALNKASDPNAGYFGYHFRVLKAQGAGVAGGAYNYVINGNMIAGFGLVAWPAAYGESGVKTFVVNQAGTVYEKDLGPQTNAVATAMKTFNPDKTWALTDNSSSEAALASTKAVPTR
jgi:hypothetical protein